MNNFIATVAAGIAVYFAVDWLGRKKVSDNEPAVIGTETQTFLRNFALEETVSHVAPGYGGYTEGF